MEFSRNILSLAYHNQIDFDTFYPKCYDLSDLVDFESFIEEFKFGFAEVVIRRFINTKNYSKLSNLDKKKIIIAIQVIHRKLTNVATKLKNIVLLFFKF